MISQWVARSSNMQLQRVAHPARAFCPTMSIRRHLVAAERSPRSIAVCAKGGRKKQKKEFGGVQTAPAEAPERTEATQAEAASPAAPPRPVAVPAAAPPRTSAPAPARPSTSGRPAAETPQVVVDRMFSRVLVCAGLPVAMGVLLFPVFWYLKVVAKLEYPIWVVYVASALSFGGGLLGITYGILSSSWDPRREGSALGWTELQANIGVLLNKDKDGQ